VKLFTTILVDEEIVNKETDVFKKLL